MPLPPGKDEWQIPYPWGTENWQIPTLYRGGGGPLGIHLILPLWLQQQILSPKPTDNYFVTPQCITNSGYNCLATLIKLKLTHTYRTTVAKTRFLQTGQSHVILYSNSHLSDDLQLTNGSCTTVANT